MSNVLLFPSRRITPRPAAPASDRAERVLEKAADLRSISRGLTVEDRKAFVRNLGDLVEARARDCQMSRSEALEIIWQQFDPKKERWSKRLRYVRFPDEEAKGGTELAASGMDFVELARAISACLPVPTVTAENDQAEALTRLMRGTAFDPFPETSFSIDFDAVRDLGELLDAALGQIAGVVPELREYFRRIEMHGLTHPEAEGPFVHDREARPMQPFDHFQWIVDEFDAPQGRDVSWNLTVSPATMHEGFWFEDGAGLDALLPRVVLGRITYAMRCGSVSEEELKRNLDRSGQLSNDEIIRSLTEDAALLDVLTATPEQILPNHGDLRLLTYEVQLVLVPTSDAASHGLRVGLIVRMPWESFADSDDEPFIGETMSYEGLRMLHDDAGGSRRFVLDRPSLQMADSPLPLPIGVVFDSLFLVPGSAAEHVLGLRHTAPIHEVGMQTIPHGISIEPNFDAPDRVTPQAATSLGGMLIRNLLFADNAEKITTRLIEDARTRASRLETRYRSWMGDYGSARSAFLKSVKAESDDE